MARPLFTVSAGMRIINAASWFAIVTTYQFGSPIIRGVAPDTLAATYSAPVVNDPTYDDFNNLPAIFTNTLTSQVLGVPVSTAVGGGTITGVSYTDSNGVLWTEVDWEWVVDVGWYVGTSSGAFDLEVVTWTGDGVNGRLVPTTLDLTTGTVVVLVWPTTSGACTMRHSGMSTSITVQRANAADGITSLTATGFTVADNVGQNVRVNVNLATYMALVMRDTTTDSRYLSVGSYAGNGIARTITTTITPAQAWVFGRAEAGAHKTELHPAAGSSAWSNEGAKPLTTQITGFTATGFTVGTDNNVNNNTLTYYWFVLANPAGSPLRSLIQTFTFTGAGIDHAVVGLGFTPAWAGIKQYLATPSSSTGWRGFWQTVLQATLWDGSSSNLVIESLDADGLTVSSVAAVTGVDLYGMAFKGGTTSIVTYAAAAAPSVASPTLGGPQTIAPGASSGGGGCSSTLSPVAVA